MFRLNIPRLCVLRLASYAGVDYSRGESNSRIPNARYKRNLFTIAVLNCLLKALTLLWCLREDALGSANMSYYKALFIYVIHVLRLYALLTYFKL